jgi:hypothetical protein
MPDAKISELTPGDPAQATDELPVARSGTNVKVTAASIAALAPAGGSSGLQDTFMLMGA